LPSQKSPPTPRVRPTPPFLLFALLTHLLHLSVDLTGLDTHYIASEADRLLDNVKLAQKTLFMPGGVFSRTSRYGDGGAGQLAARVETRLTHVVEDLRQEARFDPNQLMQELMRLDFVLRSLWAGQVLPMVRFLSLVLRYLFLNINYVCFSMKRMKVMKNMMIILITMKKTTTKRKTLLGSLYFGIFFSISVPSVNFYY